MSENKLSLLSRTYEDYKADLLAYVKQYYPQIANDFNDASIGSFLIDAIASIGDNLGWYIDKAYNETNIDTAQQASSVYAMARSKGFKVPGPKASITEEAFSIELPPARNAKNKGEAHPNYYYAPIIKRGTQVSNGSQIFEVMEDIDFSEEFNSYGEANRDVIPQRNANGDIVSYKVTKYETIQAGRSKIYKQVITSDMVEPFMEFILPDTNVINVESILFKDGTDWSYNPSVSEFMTPREQSTGSTDGKTVRDVYRYFEVESLADQYYWGDDIKLDGNNLPQTLDYVGTTSDGKEVVTSRIVKGKWVPVTQKFITEFTDTGYLKIIFGSGADAAQDNVDYNDGEPTAKHIISKMIYNNFLGRLPKAGWTMFVLYRVDGGAASNVAKGTINQFVSLESECLVAEAASDDADEAASVKNSLSCTNTIPSVSGKDAPTVDELKAMIKYHNGAQNRCVTVKDYHDRVLQMPSRYGSPFRVSTIEGNNKIMMYLLGIDADGHLSDVIPQQLIKNMQNYLTGYRSINDYIEMKSGKIINLSFEVDVFIDKNYATGPVVNEIVNVIKEYMDINKHEIGEDIFVGDIEKEVSKVDGVLNLIDLRVYNEHGGNYSANITSMATTTITTDYTCDTSEEYTPDYSKSSSQIDLEACDYILNSDADEMFEIKYPEKGDIRVRAKVR